MSDGNTQTIDVNARAKAIVDRLWSDRSEAGKKVKATAKELFPDIVIPDDPLDEAIAPLREQITALQTTLAERDAKEAEAQQKALEARTETEFMTKLNAAKSEFSLSEAGVDAVVARMKETGNYTDPQAAAAYVLRGEKPVDTAGAAMLGPQAVDFFGKKTAEDEERMKLLYSDPADGFIDYEIAKMAADPDKYARTYAPEFFSN